MTTRSGGGAALAPGYFRAGLQPASLPAVSVTHPTLALGPESALAMPGNGNGVNVRSCWIRLLAIRAFREGETPAEPQRVGCILMHLIPCLRRLGASKRGPWCIEMHPTR